MLNPLVATLLRWTADNCRALDFLEGVTSSARQAGVFASPTATAYWAYHLARSGYFTVQGLSGVNVATTLLVIRNTCFSRG